MTSGSPQLALRIAASVLWLAALSGCGAEGTISSTSPSSSSSVAISGMLSQGYVRGATVFADKLVSGSSTGNSQLEADEVSTTSSTSAQFSLSVPYDNYMIVSTGGTYLNSQGVAVPAAPMMTPAPTSSESGWNLTPLTTLVATQPDLKTTLDALGGWNADIASPSGVPAQLLRVAKTVETYWHVTSQLTDNDAAQLAAMKHLATSFYGVGLSSDNSSLELISSAALSNALSDTSVIAVGSDASAVDKETVFNSLKNALSEGVFKAIPDSTATVIESNVIADIETATDNMTQTITAVVGKAPVLTEISAISSYTSDTTPTYTFHSTNSGSISYGGNCTSSSSNALAGNNTVIFQTLAEGTHSNCTIQVTDAIGKNSDNLSVNAFTVDTTAPTLSEITKIDNSTSDSTPTYTLSSSENGTIVFISGACSSATTQVTSGNNDITMNSLQDGTYNDCILRVLDAAGNTSDNLSITAFTLDTAVPVLTSMNPEDGSTSVSVGTSIQLTFSETIDNATLTTNTDNTSCSGALQVSSDSFSTCVQMSAQPKTVANLLSFTATPADNLSSSTTYHIKVTTAVKDAAGNSMSSDNTTSTGFITADVIAPVLATVTNIPESTKDSTPDYSFQTNEAGTISYSGSCSSATTQASEGSNTITLNALSDGTYTDCKITVTDSSGNTSTLSITSFTVDTTAPVLAEVTSVLTPTNDTTPSYTFSSTQAGSITYFGDCFDNQTTVAIADNNTVTFNSLAEGDHSNCALTVTDQLGNSSDNLSITSFTVDTTAPVLAEVTSVLTPTTEASPTYVFSSTEPGIIRVSGSCQSDTKNAVQGNNTMFTFSSLSAGTYSNCTLTVIDSAGNRSDNLLVSDFEVVSSSGGEFTVAFNPVVLKIHCEVNLSQPSQLTVWAEVKDDGPLGDLRYVWYFSKAGWFGYAFESETTNPTVLYGYSATRTSGTFKIWVTDGKGLGGTTMAEQKITPHSC